MKAISVTGLQQELGLHSGHVLEGPAILTGVISLLWVYSRPWPLLRLPRALNPLASGQ